MNSHARCSGLIENLAFLRRRVVGAQSIHRISRNITALNEALGDNVGQIDDALGVAPLVIVPGDNLDHVVAHHHGERSIDGSGNIGTAEIDRHQRRLGDCKYTLHGTISGLFEGRIDFLCRDSFFLHVANEINNRDVRSGNTEGDAIELALQLGKDKGNRLGSTCGSRNDVKRSSTSAAEVAM